MFVVCRIAVGWMLALTAFACSSALQLTETLDSLPEPRQGRVAMGHPFVPLAAHGHFAVTTAHPDATRAAVNALRRGGSAIDALVAASLVLSVATPQSTGIGGGGFAIVAPADRPASAFDFREVAPAATQVNDYLDPDGRLVAARSQHHGLAVAVPGYIAGLWALHQKYGKRPWAENCQEAAALAQSGVAVTPQLAFAIAAVWSRLTPAAQATFGREGKPLAAGVLLQWPKLAATLSAIAAAGPSAFYQGPVAADMVAAVAAAGGKLTADDLANYAVREVIPLQGDVFGRQALTMPSPSAGGAQLLAMTEWFAPWQARGGAKHSYSAAPAFASHALAEAMRRSFALRFAFSGDSGKPESTIDAIYPAAARASLRDSFDPAAASTTAGLPRMESIGGTGSGAKPETHENTSHVSIVDGDGLAVSSTHTVNLLLGSGILATNSGVLLNNEMDDFSFTSKDVNAFGLAASQHNRPVAGARPVSSMTPVILMRGPAANPKGPWLVVGSPGGPRIATTVAQVIFRVAYTGWQLDDAVSTPRLHHQAVPDQVWVESGTAGDELANQLRGYGHTVERKGPWCNVQAVQLQTREDGAAQWLAVSDPRGEGLAAAR